MMYKPFFNKEKVSFIRQEKDGYVLLMLDEFPELHELIINRTTWEILCKCDGKTDVLDIVTSIVSTYDDVNQDDIQKDVASILSRFAKLGVIQWSDGNDPYIINNDIFLKNGYKIRFAHESDYKFLLEYFQKKYLKSGYSFAIFKAQEYDDINLRAKIFYRLEEFCILLNGRDELECLIGIENKRLDNVSAVANITFISDISKPQNVLFLLSFITDTYNNMALSPVLKMRAIIDETKKTSEIKELLETAGFTNEAKLKNELGENHDVSYYSIVL